MAGLNRLTAKKVQGHKKPGRLADGGGLYLYTKPDLRKSWVFKRMRNGIAPEIGLGGVDQVSLAQARSRAEKARQLQDDGRDPALALREEGDEMTFAEAAREVIAIKKAEWRSNHTLKKWERNLFKYSRTMAGRPVSQIETSHVLAVIKPMWQDRNHTARATLSMIEAVLSYAKVKGWRTGDNPAVWKNNIQFMVPNIKPRVEHHAAMPYEDVPAFAARVHETMSGMYRGGAPAALLFTMLTVPRSNEVRGARFEEFDFEALIWTVPPDRTKTGIEHKIPISQAAADLIKDRITAGVVFPGHRGRPMSDNTLRMVIRRLGDGQNTVHGFRSSFKDWATDVAKARDEVSEMCLGHLVGSAARRAYARSDAIDDRRELLERWADYVMSEVH